MNRTYDKFQVVLLSEVKGKDSNAFIFELRLTSEDNCRIRIIDFDAFDIDGNKYSAGADKITVAYGHRVENLQPAGISSSPGTVPSIVNR